MRRRVPAIISEDRREDMDGIVEALSADLLWVDVALVVLQILLTNVDKLWPVVSGRGSVERITREVPDLIKRQAELKAAGHERMAKLITGHIDGVMYPRTLRIHSKQIRREIERYLSWRNRLSFVILNTLYAWSLMVLYVTMYALARVEMAGLDGEGWTPSRIIIVSTIVLAGVFLGLTLAVLYHSHFTGMRAKRNGAYEKARAQWLKDNNLIEGPVTTFSSRHKA